MNPYDTCLACRVVVYHVMLNVVSLSPSPYFKFLQESSQLPASLPDLDRNHSWVTPTTIHTT